MKATTRRVMTMYDGGKIIPGLIIFFLLMTLPIWYNIATGKTDPPVLQKVEGQKNCVETTEFMRTWHMDLLNDWRNEVVREGDRLYTPKTIKTDKKINKSLTNKCLECHTSKAQFCDKCHDYTGVTNSRVGISINCWDCHINPEGIK